MEEAAQAVMPVPMEPPEFQVSIQCWCLSPKAHNYIMLVLFNCCCCVEHELWIQAWLDLVIVEAGR